MEEPEPKPKTSRISLEKPFYFGQKRVLIIGAGGSVGQGCAMWLLNHGSRVALVASKLSEIESIGEKFPSQSICIQCDLAVDMEQFDMVTGALEALGGLDILINCAGVIFENDLESTYPQDHDYLVDINLRSVFHISQLCSVALYKSKGCIVNLSSISRPQQGMISYCMTKAGVEMLTKSLALELSPIRVNAVAPGLLNNDFLRSTGITKEKINTIKKNFIKNHPMERLGRFDEIVKTILFLCSTKAKTITGQVIKVDGGMHLTSAAFVK